MEADDASGLSDDLFGSEGRSDDEAGEKEEESDEGIPEDLNPYDVPSATDDEGDEEAGAGRWDDSTDGDDDSSDDEGEWVYYQGTPADGLAAKVGKKASSKGSEGKSRKAQRTSAAGKGGVGFVGGRKGAGESAFAALEDYEALLDADEAQPGGDKAGRRRDKSSGAKTVSPEVPSQAKNHKKERKKRNKERGSKCATFGQLEDDAAFRQPGQGLSYDDHRKRSPKRIKMHK
eukprot:jgi/Botrbrau1/16677/Bobra.0068s0093.1